MKKIRLVMKRVGHTLHPYTDVAHDEFDKVGSLEPVMVTITAARNPLHHNKFWALAGRVADFDDEFIDADAAVRWLKRQMPEMHSRYTEKDGTLCIELRSIAFENMDQFEFDEFYKRALDLWTLRIGCDPERLERAA